jgi:UrcA family protein
MILIDSSRAHSLASVLALAVAWLIAGVALAAEQPSPPSITVTLSGGAFDTPQQLALTYGRIRNAARSVCGAVDRAFPQERAAWDSCVASTIRRAVQDVGNAALSDYYLGKRQTVRGHWGDVSPAQTRQP